MGPQSNTSPVITPPVGVTPAESVQGMEIAALPSEPQGCTGVASTSEARPQVSVRSQLEQQQRPLVARPPSNTHSKTLQPQRQVSNGPTAEGGTIPLPGNARTHFFLSHCQATGGDQTNAIYLELRQLGFSCW
jgi:hypothetical protein